MIFLNPAFLFGLLAASIPVIIHLFNLRKLKKIDFSTLAFLKELQKNKIRKIKLKQWLLLALRVLIILFAVLAFARPTLQNVSIGGTTSAAKTTAVFILDDTYSMSVVDQKGSYFNQAVQKIKTILSQMQEGDEAGLILVSKEKSFENLITDLSSFNREINLIEISSASGNLNNALIKAAQLISESKNFNKEIYVLSDFQKNKIFNENELSDLSEIFNESIKLYEVNLSKSDVYNLSIDDLKINKQIFEKEIPVSFSVTITNYSQRDATNSVVSLFLNGERVAQKSFDVLANQTAIVELEAAPKTTGYIEVVAEIESDDNEYDNKRFANFYISEKIPVGIFAETSSDLSFVKIALQTAGENRYEIESKNLSQISAQPLNKYSAVIISTSKTFPGVEAIKNYAVNGGGVLVFPASLPSLTSLNSFLSQLGLNKSQSLVGKINSTEFRTEFDKIDFNHPVFQNIFKDENKNKIESPSINFYYRYSAIPLGTEIISLLDGSSFLSEYRTDKGKVLFFNLPPALQWSDFPIKSIFAPIINKSVIYLASKERGQNILLAGDEANINLQNSSGPQIKVIKPDNSEELINTSENAFSNYLKFENTFNTGNYKFISGSKQIEVISVNTDPTESKIEYASSSEFSEYLEKINFEGKHLEINKDDDPLKIILQARFGSELWRYFLIAAIILAIVEMTIARNTKKEIQGLTN